MPGEAGSSKREQNQRDRRERLMNAASILFAQVGFAATTTDEIAAAAGLSRATFFNYFGSKDAVADALHARRMAELYQLVDYLLSLDRSTGELIVMMFEDIARTDERQPGLLRAEIESLERTGAAAHVRAERTEQFIAEVLRILRRGRKRGEVRADYPLRFLAEMVSAIYLSVVRKWEYDPALAVGREFTRAGRFAASLIVPQDGTAP